MVWAGWSMKLWERPLFQGLVGRAQRESQLCFQSSELVDWTDERQHSNIYPA